MVWSQTDANAHGFEGQGLGIMFQGTEATLVADYSTLQDLPREGPARSSGRPRRLPRSVGHHREWLDAIKTREPVLVPLRVRPPPDAPSATSATSRSGPARSSSGTPGRADHQPPEANQYLTKEYRKPWTLPSV